MRGEKAVASGLRIETMCSLGMGERVLPPGHRYIVPSVNSLRTLIRKGNVQTVII